MQRGVDGLERGERNANRETGRKGWRISGMECGEKEAEEASRFDGR